jgi:Hemerythrin HHE cation binding domain
MVEPVDVILAFHNAFRNDMERIDTAALDSARGKGGLAATIERFRFFNEMLVWHAHGEELAIFPRLETVAPLVAEAYLKDHHGLDSAFDTLNTSYAARDPLQTARATAAFRFHLDIHLYKEDTHLYRIFRERIPMPEQGKALGIMAGAVPQERFPELVAWLFPLIGHDDRENMTRIWQTMMPAPAFAGVKDLIKKAIGNDWAELVRRIPTLEGK